MSKLLDEASIRKNMKEKLDKLVSQASPENKSSFEREMNSFNELFDNYLRNRNKGYIDWAKINPPPEEMVIDYNKLSACNEETAKSLANKICVLKLNGGLGTTMGCTGPKSVIEVRNDLTFLDLTVLQAENLNKKYHSEVPLILMNSFNTHDETLKIVKKYDHSNVKVLNFNQSRFPRIYKDTLLPVANTPDEKNQDKDAWFPPGHGDVFDSFNRSGLLDEMIKQGKEYVFISNVDNLGATVDFRILNFMVTNQVDFIMEVTNKTRSDIKGGTLIAYEDRAKLLEIAQCPPNRVEEFKSIKKFKIFNTNNLWVNLKAIKHALQENHFRNMDIIINPKKLKDGSNCLQLETAAGAAIEFFKNAKGVNVERSRFLPVKATSDLLVLQSNLYELKEGELVMSPKRIFPTVPVVKLGEEFRKVGDYMARFNGIPDILELDQLTISGDVTIGSGVVLKVKKNIVLL